MQLSTFSPRRLTGAAAIACAAALIPVAALATACPAAAAPGARGEAAAVPAAFEPVSASFRSPARGVVLGRAGCAGGHACRARLMATTSGGARRHFVTAPDIRLFNSAGDLLRQASRVSGVVFASRRNGWLYSPGLWATHDGGARWRRISLRGDIVPSLGGGVVSVAVSAGTAYAVVSPDPFHAKPEELFRSPAGSNAWTRVGTMTGDPFAVLAVSGKAAWFGTSKPGTSAGTIWATADGVHWHKYPFTCPAGSHLSSIAAASQSRVVFLCVEYLGTFHSDKYALRSVNGGRTEYLAGQAAVGGDAYGIAVPPHRSKVITITVITPGPDLLDRSADGGKTWAQIAVPGTEGGVDLSSLSYVSRTVGWIVAGGPGDGSQHQLLQTTDAGRTWHQVRF